MNYLKWLKLESLNLGIMLIGGPNQSHKVNFKEPVPLKGKMFKRTFAFQSVNPFPKKSEKNLRMNALLLVTFVLQTRVWRGQLLEGDGEHAIHDLIIKTFLKEKNPSITIFYISML